MRLSNFQWIRNKNRVFGLCICLVLIGLITAGAAESIAPNDVYSAQSSTGGNPPDIRLFKAEPMVLNASDSAIYTFAVRHATRIHIIEAGNSIKEISNPSAATIKGTANGLPASALQTGDSNTFMALLIASNNNGDVQAELTLSFATEGEPEGQPEEQQGATDNQPEPRSPKWLEQYSSPFSPARSSISGTEPKFFKCPSDCNNCLKPEEAKSQGMGERCSAERCYYSPDNQQNWYCYKPAPGWCCNNSIVSQATKDECTRMGGSWFLNQYEAQERCQPIGYCCRDGNIYQATKSQCIQAGDTYYENVIEAKERCLPPCYCCLSGQVFQSNQSQCIQSGGTCYTTQYEALERCQPIGWCCLNGQVYQATQAQCAQMGGSYWSTSQAQVLERCQPSCWCCLKGQVYQTSQSQCAQYGGNCYTTQAEALRYCQQQSTCWCCLKGQVYQTSQSQCLQSGGACYSTQSQANAACTLKTPSYR